MKQISSNFSRNKYCESIIKPVISLVLVTASIIFSNNGYLEDKLREVKEKIASHLKETLRSITVAKTKLDSFNIQHKSAGLIEMQVRNIILCPAISLFNCI